MKDWRREGTSWMFALDDAYTLELRGLGLHLHPATPETLLEYWCQDGWLELGLEPTSGDWANGAELNQEIDLLGTLASGESECLRVANRVWTVAPFPDELLNNEPEPS